MSAIRRPAVLLAALAVSGSALTACGSGPTQANSAVIIGDRVITVDDVQQRLDKALNAEPAAKDLAKNRKLDLVSRGIVNTLVRHELITEAAKRDNLSVSEKDVADFVARSAPPEDPVQRSVDAGFDSRELARDRLLEVALGRKYVDKVQLTLDGAALVSPNTTRQTAVDMAKKIAAHPDQVAQLAKAAATPDGQNQEVAELPWNVVRRFGQALQSAQSNGQNQAPPAQAMLPELFAAPPNSVIALQLGSGEQAESGGWLVALVRRSDNGVPEQEASFASEVPPDWLFALGEHLLGPLAADLGIRISPRYGVWDDLSVGVAPGEAEKTGVVLPAATKQP
jgi:SurA-like N-terminal domain